MACWNVVLNLITDVRVNAPKLSTEGIYLSGIEAAVFCPASRAGISQLCKLGDKFKPIAGRPSEAWQAAASNQNMSKQPITS